MRALVVGLLAFPSLALAQQQPCQLRQPSDVSVSCAPVSAWDALSWTYLAFDPSESNPLAIRGVQPEAVLPTGSVRNPATEKRIVLFGDLMPMQKDSIPLVHQELRDLFASADLVIGNVESPVYRSALHTSANQSTDFHASTNFIRSFFTQYCIDPHEVVLSVANNHANDHGRWPETVGALIPESQEPGQHCALPVRGVVGKAAGDEQVDVFDVGGLRVGVVGWTEVENCPRANAWRRPAQVLNTDWERVKAERDLDLLIGVPHWDRQFHFFPSVETYVRGELLIEAGFDVIAGSHPSVLQPGRVFDNRMVLYSLSSVNVNFSANATNAVFALELNVDAQGRIARYKLHPFAQRKVSATNLPASVRCADGRVATDLARPTEYEIVPLREISNTWGVRDRLQRAIDLTWPR
ncbi:MAG: CapA family protein [Polyangiales bacterium]